jgi:hypothetical protein
VAEVHWHEEGGVGGWYVECPKCHVRIAVVKGYEPPNLEKALNESLNVHLENHARGMGVHVRPPRREGDTSGQSP